MNHKILLTAGMLLYGGGAFGACTPLGSCPSGSWYTEGSATGCASYAKTCYKGNGSGTTRVMISCTSCPSGQNLIGKQYQTECTELTYYTCGCTNGCSTTAWKAKGVAYQERTVCNTSNCTTRKEYRCAAGYYGSSSNGTSGCTRCPSSGGVYGTSAAGSTAITSCYLPSGTVFSDSSGRGTYTANCYYSN